MNYVGPIWSYVVHKILEISSLSATDYTLICATYTNMATGNKDEVDRSLSNRGYSEAALEAARKQSQANFSPVVIQNIRFERHLSNFKYGLMSYVLYLFSHFERGILPFPGSLSEQPAQILEIFKLLSKLKSDQEMKQEQKASNQLNVKRNTRKNYGRPR